MKKLLLRQGRTIKKWGTYDAIIDGEKVFIRPGSKKTKGWQITFRDIFKNHLQKEDGSLLMPRDGIVFVPLKVVKKAIKENGLIPLKELDKNFAQDAPREKISLAYAESRLLVDYILSRYNYYLLNQFTSRIASGKPLEHALEKVFYTDLPRFEQNWKSYIRQKYF